MSVTDVTTRDTAAKPFLGSRPLDMSPDLVIADAPAARRETMGTVVGWRTVAFAAFQCEHGAGHSSDARYPRGCHRLPPAYRGRCLRTS
jgi:hypothetical protein